MASSSSSSSRSTNLLSSRCLYSATETSYRTPDVVTTPLAGVSYATTPVFHDDQDDVTGNDYFLLAKSYFDCREYRRAAHALRDQTGKKAVFLRCYALCSLQTEEEGEQGGRREEERGKIVGARGVSRMPNVRGFMCRVILHKRLPWPIKTNKNPSKK